MTIYHTAILQNAKRHVTTARLLMNASSFREAAFFALVAAEECAKLKLVEMGAKKDALRHHNQKQKMFLSMIFPSTSLTSWSVIYPHLVTNLYMRKT